MSNIEIEESFLLLEELIGANIFLYSELETVWNHFLHNGADPDYANIFSLYGKSLGLLEKLENYPFAQAEHVRIFEEQVAFCLQNQSLHDTVYDQYKDRLAEKLTDSIGQFVNFFESLRIHWDDLLASYDPEADEAPIETVLNLRDSIGYVLMAVQILQGKREQYAGVPVWTYERRMLLADATLKVIVLGAMKDDAADMGRSTAPRDFWWRHLE